MIQKLGRFDDMFDLVREFDRFFHRPAWQLATPHVTFHPAVECFSRDKMLVLRVELPGMDPKDVEVSISGNQIVLRGEKKEERKADERDLFIREVSYGRFERLFTLPEGAKTDHLKASFQNGVLELTMPAGLLEQARKVPIVIGDGAKQVKAA